MIVTEIAIDISIKGIFATKAMWIDFDEELNANITVSFTVTVQSYFVTAYYNKAYSKIV